MNTADLAIATLGLNSLVTTGALVYAVRNEGDDRDPVYVIMDGPPGPHPGRFVEVEDEDGNSLNVGEWSKHPTATGLWRLKV